MYTCISLYKSVITEQYNKTILCNLSLQEAKCTADKSSTPNSAASMLSDVISIGSTVKVLVDYRPVRDDEIGATKVMN